jgi:uncharacterized protein
MADGKHGLFVDTSGWIEVFGSDNPLHGKARDILAQATNRRRPIITTNYVIIELISNGCKKCHLSREGLFKAVREITKLRGIEIVHISAEIHNEEISRLSKWVDKKWSLVDATSFNIMHQRMITDALAKDGHFHEAGFIELLSLSTT